MEHRSRGGTLGYRIGNAIDRFVAGDQAWLALAVAAALLLFQAPGINDLLTSLGVENSTRLRTAVAIIILTSILLELRQVRLRLTPEVGGRQQYPDPEVMYVALKEQANAITDPRQREMKVLGLTLASAWQHLSLFFEKQGVEGWTVKLATLSKEAGASHHWVPSSWPQEVASTISQINEFKHKQGKSHHHEIEIHEYEFPPAVHGFELGNGDVFLSTLQWENGVLGRHPFSYDYVPAHDSSLGATAVREQFRSWFERALTSASEDPQGSKDSAAG